MPGDRERIGLKFNLLDALDREAPGGQALYVHQLQPRLHSWGTALRDFTGLPLRDIWWPRRVATCSCRSSTFCRKAGGRHHSSEASKYTYRKARSQSAISNLEMAQGYGDHVHATGAVLVEVGHLHALFALLALPTSA